MSSTGPLVAAPHAAAEETSAYAELRRETEKLRLQDNLARHRRWVESGGEEGTQLDLSHAQLAGADLTGAFLVRGVLHKTNLRGADLSFADLREANLTEADLREVDFLGTEFEGADLRGANLEGASGLLWIGHLAGTQLGGATLPAPLSEFDGTRFVARACRTVLWLWAAVLLASVVACWFAVRTPDIEVLTNAPSVPMPWGGQGIRLMGFFLAMPILLLVLYICFHVVVQQLCSRMANLPAMLPNGHGPADAGPWPITALVRGQVRWLRQPGQLVGWLEAAIAAVLAYWVAPAILVLFWGRSLTRQDLRDTMLQMLLVVVALGFAVLMPRLARRLQHVGGISFSAVRDLWTGYGQVQLGLILAAGVFLTLLSLGIIYGLPHNGNSASVSGSRGPRTWAADALWAVGYDPFADFSERAVSAAPSNWSGLDEDLGKVKGARLNKLRVHYAVGYRAFLANAQLRGADLKGAYLAEADLRGANLRQASLESAVLERARVTVANLSGANLQEANLVKADLRQADLSHALLARALLLDARMEKASLYAAHLDGAQMIRVNLEGADLREARLESVKLSFARLSQAYLWSAKLSGAQLSDTEFQQAILIEADLRHADLRRAKFQGAILQGANLGGANLQGADLRGAIQLTAQQVCAAAERSRAEMDDVLQQQVESLCGGTERANPPLPSGRR